MIRRFGVIFILYPIFVLCYLLHIVFVMTCAIWGPIYYIITGLDPLEQDIIFFFMNIGVVRERNGLNGLNGILI